MGIEGRIIHSDFGKISDRSVRNVRAIIKNTAFSIEGSAKVRAPVDTGFLRNSIQSTDASDLEWWVVVGAEYGIFVEYGHHTRGGTFVAPQPFLSPAVEKFRGQFEEKMKKAVA